MSAGVAVLDRLTALTLVPVVVVDDAADAVPLVQALRDGGLPVAEITFRTAAGPDAIRAVVDAGLAEDGALVGAGTVTTAAEVDTAVGAGARFVVSPGFSQAVVDRCREHGVTVVPGVVTPTEIQAALDVGLSTVKFFPAASSGGPAAIKALAGPFPQVRMVPTGGVGPENLGDYLALPTVAAVGGSWMVPRAAIRGHDFTEIRRLTEDAVHLAQRFREEE